jgi:hypothetical protein
VIADADSEVTVQPASGQKIGNGEQPPRYLAVDTPVSSPKVINGSTNSIATGRWKRVGASWVPLYSATGWAELLANLMWVDLDDTGISYVDGGSFDVPGLGGDPNETTYQLRVGDPGNSPAATPQPFLDQVVLDGTPLVSGGTLAVGLPYTDGTTGVRITAIDIPGGQVTFDYSLGGVSAAPLPLSVDDGAGNLIDVTVNVQNVP